MRKIVTSYIKPDMDGIASMYAYSEYLRKKGFDADYYFEGIARKEVQIVLDTYNIKLNNIDKINNDDEVVLVDTIAYMIRIIVLKKNKLLRLSIIIEKIIG